MRRTPSRRPDQKGAETAEGTGNGLRYSAVTPPISNLQLPIARFPPSLPPQHQAHLLAHDAAVAVHEGEFAGRQLPLAGPALELPHGLRDVGHAAGETRLAEGELPAVRVERQVTPVCQVVLPREHAAPSP